MYVLSASAQAADRDQEAFQIRKRHMEKTAIYVRKLAYMAVFLGKRFGQIFQCNELKNIQ